MSEDPAPGTVYNPFLYDGDDVGLQRMILVGVCVAGKVARQQQDKFDAFERILWQFLPKPEKTIFDSLRKAEEFCPGWIDHNLRRVKMGQYRRITPAFQGLITTDPDLRKCTRDELCKIHGIGMKTASFFIMFTRRDSDVACLDTHILAWMRETGLADTPKTTPGDRVTYLLLECIFLNYCKKVKRPPGEVDFEIWLQRNRGDKQKPK